jgi:hypothetical protein
VISRLTPSFRRSLAQLTEAERAAARRAYRLFMQDCGHNSLRFKKLEGYPNLWSVRVNGEIRAVGARTGDTVRWVWIGHHAAFDNLF